MQSKSLRLAVLLSGACLLSIPLLFADQSKERKQDKQSPELPRKVESAMASDEGKRQWPGALQSVVKASSIPSSKLRMVKTNPTQTVPHVTLQAGGASAKRKRGGSSQGQGVALGITGTEVFSNAQGQFVYPPGANVLIADDITTTCAGLALSYLEVKVNGGGTGTGAGFSTNFQLYDGCPSDGGVPIPGTSFTANLPNDGDFVLGLDLGGAPLQVAGSFWLGLSVSTDLAGWYVGNPADTGFSEDIFDGPFPCVTFFGGWPANPHASFYARVFAAEGTCETVFLAYQANEFSGFFTGIELNQQFGDDIKSITTDLGLPFRLSRFQTGLAGVAGAYQMSLGLWTHDPLGGGGDNGGSPLAPVLATQVTFPGVGNGFLEVADFTFSPPIEVSVTPGAAEPFWHVYELLSGSSGNAGPILVAEFPNLGFSDDCFALFGDPDPGQWSQCVWFFGGCPPQGDAPCATFQNFFYAAGDPPIGACCGFVGPGVLGCEEGVPFADCAGRFVLDGSCSPDPFEPPCGTAACCLADESCSNLTDAECQANGGLWQPGEFCGEGDQTCPPPACITAENPCNEESLVGGGCNDPACCAAICALDDFCCAVFWDQTCASVAQEQCSIPLPIAQTDSCPGPTISPDGSYSLDNTFGTDVASDPAFSCHNDPDFNNGRGFGSVWVNFVATETGLLRASTCRSVAPADDSLLAVYRVNGSCANLVPVGCSDDVDGCIESTGFGSDICLSGLTPGQTYAIQLAAWTEQDRGNYILDLSSAGCAPIPGDNCADAIAIGDGTFNYFTLGENNTRANTDGPALPASCDEGFGLFMGHDVWFNFTAPSTGTTTVELCTGTDYDSRISVYNGFGCPQTTGNTLACNDDGCPPDNPQIAGPSRMQFDVVQGGQYKIRVGGYTNNGPGGPPPVGNGTMVVTTEGGCNCPDGAVTFTNPLNNTVDARQPHPINNTSPAQGIQTLTVSGPSGADSCCWSLCETAELGGPNSIASVTENSGVYTVNLARPITRGAVTRVAYNGSTQTIGSFISHPANVNGDGASSPVDILRIIDFLNGAFTPPWGIYSTDIDRSGATNPADILRVIDLLNGADQFDVWNNVPLPGGSCNP